MYARPVRLSLWLLAALLLPLARVAAQNPPAPVSLDQLPKEGKYALLIGVGDYRNLPPLKFTACDAHKTQAVLVSRLNFDPGQIVTMTDDAKNPDLRPSSLDNLNHQFLPLLDKIEVRIKKGEQTTFLVYFSGHGVRMDGEDWLISGGADPKWVTHFSLEVHWLLKELEKFPSLHTLLIFDACRDTPTGKGIGVKGTRIANFGEEPLLPRRFQGVLYGCKRNQSSHESTTLKQGLFTYCLAKALEGAPGAADGKTGFVTFKSLKRYLDENVNALARDSAVEQNPDGNADPEDMPLVRAEGVLPAPNIDHKARAEELLHLGKVREAAQEAREAVKARPEDPFAYELLARLLLGTGEYDACVQAANKALEYHYPLPASLEALIRDVTARKQGQKPKGRGTSDSQSRPTSQVFQLTAYQDYPFAAAACAATKKETLAEARRLLDEGQIDQAAHAAERAVEDDAANTEAQMLLGRLRMLQHRPSEALRAFETAQQLSPGYASLKDYLSAAREAAAQQEADSLVQAAAEAEVAGDLDAAVNRANHAIAVDPGNAQAQAVLGKVFLAQNLPAKAEAAFQRAIELDPGLSSLQDQVELARTLQRRAEAARRVADAEQFLTSGKTADAVEAARAAIDRSPRDPRAHVLLGRILVREKQWAEALREFQSALSLDPSVEGASEGLRQVGAALGGVSAARLLMEAGQERTAGRLDRAEALAREALAKDPENAAAWMLLGELSLDRKRFEEAAAEFNRAAALGSTGAAEALERAKRQHAAAVAVGLVQAAEQDLKNDRLLDAVSKTRAALGQNPDDANACALLAYALLMAGQDGEEAEASLRRAEELAPGSKYVHLARSVRPYSKKRYSEAAKELRAALEIDPNLVLALNNLTAVLGCQGGKRAEEEAEDLARRAVELEKDYAYPYGNLASLYFAHRKYADAERLYDQAIRRQPDRGVFYLYRAVSLFRLDQTEEARKVAQQALELGVPLHVLPEKLRPRRSDRRS